MYTIHSRLVMVISLGGIVMYTIQWPLQLYYTVYIYLGSHTVKVLYWSTGFISSFASDYNPILSIGESVYIVTIECKSIEMNVQQYILVLLVFIVQALNLTKKDTS